MKWPLFLWHFIVVFLENDVLTFRRHSRCLQCDQFLILCNARIGAKQCSSFELLIPWDRMIWLDNKKDYLWKAVSLLPWLQSSLNSSHSNLSCSRSPPCPREPLSQSGAPTREKEHDPRHKSWKDRSWRTGVVAARHRVVRRPLQEAGDDGQVHKSEVQRQLVHYGASVPNPSF